MATGTDLREGLAKLSQLSQETILLNYDHIELDGIELEEALRKAREEKHFRLKRQAYNKRLIESPRWFVPSAIELKNLLLSTVSKNGNPFEITEFNREVIDQLCLYFANDPDFKGDPKKGIMLMGNPGVGKTHLMNFFAKNPKASYIIPTCKIITERYSNKWSHEEKSTIEYYSELKRAEVGHQWDQIELGACFGDLGAETGEASSFGNR